MSLLDELLTAEVTSAKKAGCPLCMYINGIDDEETKVALTRAAAGTIGLNVLTRILSNSNTGIGNRTIKRHREEEHTP